MLNEANAFATIVGLLSAFISGRGSELTSDVAEFKQWLADHRHEDFAQLIEDNHNTTISVKALLSHQTRALDTKLSELSRTTAFIASRMPDLDQLAKSLVSGIAISDQAMAVLTHMSESNSEFFLVRDSMNGTTLIMSRGEGYRPEESQFLRDDLNTLLECRLLHLDHNGNGDEMYYFSRAAKSLVSDAPCAG